MEIRWNDTPRKTWDRATRHAAWQQGWAYGAALAAAGRPVHRATITEDGETVGLAQFTGRRVLGHIDITTCTRGPVWLTDVPDTLRQHAYRTLRTTIPLKRLRGVFITPEADIGETGLLRGARYRQVMSPFSTATLDLTLSDDDLLRAMQGKWRNRLRRSEEAGMKIAVKRRKPGGYDRLLAEEATQQKRRKYRTLPPAFVPAWQGQAAARDGVVLAEATSGTERLGSMLFLVHGAGALYHFGMASAAGRAVNAHNLLLWRAIRALRKDGVETLDLGGLDTVDNPGIARFKLGSGARVRSLCGTWC